MDDNELKRLRNFEANAGGDSDEEEAEYKMLQKKLKREKYEKKEFDTKKAIEKEKKLHEQFKMINEKSTAFRDRQGPDLDVTNKLGHKKAVNKRILKDKIETGKSKFEDSKNKQAFKEQPKMKEFLREKIEKTRKRNMKKINSLKVKTVKY